jgi:hypothetical protein
LRNAPHEGLLLCPGSAPVSTIATFSPASLPVKREPSQGGPDAAALMVGVDMTPVRATMRLALKPSECLSFEDHDLQPYVAQMLEDITLY